MYYWLGTANHKLQSQLEMDVRIGASQMLQLLLGDGKKFDLNVLQRFPLSRIFFRLKWS